MSKETTAGKVILKHYLPKDFASFIEANSLDKKGLTKLFSDLSEHHAADYNTIASKLARFGFEVATRQGSSVSLEDLRSPIDKEEHFGRMDKEIATINEGHGSQEKKNEKIFDVYHHGLAAIEKEILAKGLAQGKTLAKIVLSGSRASPAQYRSTVASTGIVVDAKGNPLLDFPIKSSFAEGLTPTEYLNHSYGARAGEIAKKLATADSGDLSKQLARASMTLKIEEHDCGTEQGIPVSTTDKDSIGTFLAKGIGGFNRNNEVTSKMLNELHAKKIDSIVVRSPITCHASRNHHYGAVCQLCAGRREKGLPPINSYVGMLTASSLGEPLAQGQMNLRHSGGAASKAGITSGFKLINQLFNIPKHFPGKALVVPKDGTIEHIKPAAGGGTFVTISGTEHYVPQDLDVTAKVGQQVEEGDIISEGIVNPSDIVEHKGIGEGRRYFAEQMHKAFNDSGMPVNRRNFEMVARGAIDHVKVTDPEGLGDYLHDQIVSYQTIEKDYKPRHDSKTVRLDVAKHKFLEQPVLHYSIGTRLTSSVLDNLKAHKIEHVVVNDHRPAFEPVMERLKDVPAYVPDWVHQMYSTNLEKRLVDAVNKGLANTSSLKGPSPILGLAYSVDFGQHV